MLHEALEEDSLEDLREASSSAAARTGLGWRHDFYQQARLRALEGIAGIQYR